MSIFKDERMVKSKRNKDKLVKKVTYRCVGSYVDINGTPQHYHKRGFKTLEEAKEWERNFLLKAKNEVTTNITFNEIYELYKETKKGTIKDRSFNDMEYLIKSWILPYWGDKNIKKITIQQIEKFQKSLLSKKNNNDEYYSNRYLESIQTQFKAVMRYAFNHNYFTDNRLISFPIIKRAGEIKKEMDFFTPEEFIKFIHVVDELPYFVLFNVLYWCGTRLGETLALTWKDIDLKNKSIRINKSYSKHTRQTTAPKTNNSYRNILVPEMCLKALEQLKNIHKMTIGYDDNKLVFNFDKHLDENAIRTRKNKWCEQAQVKQIRIHDFRHSHVSLLINMGFNPFEIAKRLGHTVEMVNETYGHLFQEAQQNMINKLDELSIKLNAEQ